MQPVLDQNEVRALLDAMKSGGLTDGADKQQPEATPYDITVSKRVVRGRLPVLEMINDRQARLHRTSLSTIARRSIEVSYRSTSIQRFSEVIASIANPSCLSIVRFNPLSGTSLVAFDTGFLFGVLDALFGGDGSVQSREGLEDFTAVEIRLARRIVDAVISDLERAWAPITRLRGEFVRTEANPKFVTIAAPSDLIVDIDYLIDSDLWGSGALRIIIPYASLQPLHGELSSALYIEEGAGGEGWGALLEEHVQKMPVEYAAILGSTELTLSEILTLDVGDIIELNNEAADPVSVFAEDIDIAKGHPMILGQNVAVRLTKPVAGPHYRADRSSPAAKPKARKAI